MSIQEDEVKEIELSDFPLIDNKGVVEPKNSKQQQESHWLIQLIRSIFYTHLQYILYTWRDLSRKKCTTCLGCLSCFIVCITFSIFINEQHFFLYL